MPHAAFDKALEKFKQGLDEKQRLQFAASTLDEVEAEIQRIQDQHGSQKRLRSLSRISRFLEAMTQIEHLVSVYLNVSNLVAFVWGPIKLVLQVAGKWVEALECLLDTYAEIAEVIPSLTIYSSLFRAAPRAREVLEKYICDILEFHHLALDVFTKKAWKSAFHMTWKSRFNPILESLKRHRILLRDEGLIAAILEIQRSRCQSTTQSAELQQRVEEVYLGLSGQVYALSQSIEDHSAKYQRGNLLRDRQFIVSKLDPPGFESDHHSALSLCYGGSGSWVFQHDMYIQWMNGSDPSDAVLFISGMPGAGKTILASTIIHYLKAQVGRQNTCSFFYFRKREENKKTMSHMLRALLVQLMDQDDSVVQALYEKCCTTSDGDARGPSTLKRWAVEILKVQSRCTIVLDGLDECNHHGSGYEARDILQWFRSIIPECFEEGSEVRLLALGQRDGVVDEALSGCPSMRLDDAPSHQGDISSFAEERSRQIKKRFGLDEHAKAHIVGKVTSAAKELKVHFPAGLDDAYERAISRVLWHPSRLEPQREAASKILAWLSCAVRPLRWREIQCLFCIDPHKGTCNAGKLRVDGCKTICGSLVETDQQDSSAPCLRSTEPVVTLVHETARHFLIERDYVNIREANARMAIFASAYLASPPFHIGHKGEDMQTTVLSGYYGFQDYAVPALLTHVQLSACQGTPLPSSTLSDLRNAFSALQKHLGLASTEGPPKDLEDLKDPEKTENLLRRLEYHSTASRTAIECINPKLLEDRTRDIFLSLNGEPQYKCSKPLCFMFSHGFENKRVRSLHVSQHYRQLYCPLDGCPYQTIGFCSRGGFEQHAKEAHTEVKRSELFPSSRRPQNIWKACELGDIDAVKQFHAAGIDLQTPNPNRGDLRYLRPIFIAIRYGHTELCEYLMQNGCTAWDPAGVVYPNLGRTALEEAIRVANKPLVDSLLALSSENDVADFTNGDSLIGHITQAIHCGEREILDTMLSLNRRRECPVDFPTIFHNSIPRRSVLHAGKPLVYEMFFSFLTPEEKTIVLTTQKAGVRGRGCLHQACKKDNQQALAFLLPQSDNQSIHVPDANGRNPLRHAIQKSDASSLGCVRLIFEHDRCNEMEFCDKAGNRPLHVACQLNKVEVVKLLLPHSLPYLNDSNADGNTPLHLTIRSVYRAAYHVSAQMNIIRALLETGLVDLSKRNIEDKTVFDMSSDPEILSILDSANVDADGNPKTRPVRRASPHPPMLSGPTPSRHSDSTNVDSDTNAGSVTDSNHTINVDASTDSE
ncbi:hypothetical protein F4780DRAFT_197555 [Xylariomycetidae sp. FL0641]|nr:hypothetical protein F4780DRAFT_197555 [Xylariomycetidae sp. FL0641]